MKFICRIIFLSFIVFFFLFYLFLQNKSGRKENIGSGQSLIAGGIIPHHQVAGFMIDDFFLRIKKQAPSTIILIGPNHFELGDAWVVSADCLLSGDKKVSIKSDTVKEMEDKGLVKTDNGIVDQEHSIMSIIPYIQKYLPQTEIIPIIFKKGSPLSKIEKITDFLVENYNTKTVIISSVDFSHYLTAKLAEKNDKISINAIKNSDYRQIYQFNNAFLDSPPSVILLLGTMEKLGRKNLEILNHSNSGTLLGKNFMQTTSYYEIAFH